MKAVIPALAILLVAAAPVPKGEIMLDRASLDPALILPPPPARDSPQALRELAELHNIETMRTPAMEAAARHDSATKNASIFEEAMGEGFDLENLPQTTALFAIVRATEKDAADRSKAFFRRERPWIVEPTLKTCGADDDQPLTSYPSGHTTMAFAMGAILARLAPDRGQAIMARAARYGESRISCEVHFRSDVTGGQTLGLVIADRLMEQPRFQMAYAAAKAELKLKHILR